MSNPAPETSIENRLENLHKETRALRATVFGLLVVVVMLTIWPLGILRPKRAIVEGSQFILRDDDGKKRGALYLDTEGVHFNLYDQNEKNRLGLGLTNDDVAALGILDTQGKTRVALSMIEGQAGINLVDKDGTFRTSLTVDQDGNAVLGMGDGKRARLTLGVAKDRPQLILMDTDGKPRAHLSVNEFGPMLDFFDGQRHRLRLDVYKDEAGLHVFDDKGKKREHVGISKHGPAIRLLNENEEVQLGFIHTEKGPALMLLDEGGKASVTLIMEKDGGSMTFDDDKGKKRLFLGLGKSGPGFQLFDENGKPLLSKP